MRQHKFYGPWCSFFQFCLDRAKLSQYAFADLVKESQPAINQYVSGRSKPPIDKVERFAVILKLNHDDAERFIWLAHQSYTPPVVWERLMKLEDLFTSMEAELISLRTQLADLGQNPRSPRSG